MRELILEFTEGGFAKFKQDFQLLNAKDRVKTYVDLMSFVMPKLKDVSMEIDINTLPENHVDEMLQKLLNG